jgi:hypothetical protein
MAASTQLAGHRRGDGDPGGRGNAFDAAATIEAFEDLALELIPGTGLLAATVPGAVPSWLTLLRDHGTLPLEAVLRFAVEYAEHGHPLHPDVCATPPRDRRAEPAGRHRRAGLAHDELPVVVLPPGDDSGRGSSWSPG